MPIEESLALNLIAKDQNLQKSLQGVVDNLVQIGASLAAVKQSFAIANDLIETFGKQEQAVAKLDAIIKATGQSAGFTSKEMQNMAAGLQQVTTFGDEAIINGQAILATFKTIGKETFPRATKTILDLSAAFGQDLKQSAIQVGKALEDPVKGMAALRRIGVSFSAEQKKVIEGLVKTNQLAKAQGIILKVLEGQVGGVAERMAKTASGALKQFNNQLGDLKEQAGKAILEGLKPFIDIGNKLLEAFNKLDPSMKKTIIQFATLAAVVGPILLALPGIIKLFKTLFKSLTAGTSSIGAVIAGLTAMVAAILAVNNMLNKINKEQKKLDKVFKDNKLTLKSLNQAYAVQTIRLKEIKEASKTLFIDQKKIRDEQAKLNAITWKRNNLIKETTIRLKKNLPIDKDLLKVLKAGNVEKLKTIGFDAKLINGLKAAYDAHQARLSQEKKAIALAKKRAEQRKKMIKDEIEIQKQFDKMAAQDFKRGEKEENALMKKIALQETLAKKQALAAEKQAELLAKQLEKESVADEKRAERAQKEFERMEVKLIKAEEAADKMAQAEIDAFKKLDEEDEAYRKKQEKRRAKELDRAKNEWTSKLNLVKKTAGTISNIIGMGFDNAIAWAEEEYKEKRRYIDENVSDEGERARKLEALEKEKEAEIRQIKRNEFEVNKIAAIAESLIATAVGVTKAIPNLPLMALAGVLGAVQTGMIAAQPNPYAYGGEFLTSGPMTMGNSLLGDNPSGVERVTVEPLDRFDNSKQPIVLTIMMDSKTLYSGIFEASRNREIKIAAGAVVAGA